MLNGDSPYYITTLKEILHSNENVSTLAVKFASRWEGNQGDKTKERVNNAQQVLNYLKHPTSGGAKGRSKSVLYERSSLVIQVFLERQKKASFLY